MPRVLWSYEAPLALGPWGFSFGWSAVSLGQPFVRVLTKDAPGQMPRAQLLTFAHDADALTYVWQTLRARGEAEWPRLLDLSLHRIDGSEVGFDELLFWADFGARD